MASRVDGGFVTVEAAPVRSPHLRRALSLTLPDEAARVDGSAPGAVLVRSALARLTLQLLHYEVLIRLRGDAEDVHHARSTIRRLRAVLRGLRAFLDRVWADTLREELRWFAGELAAVRDIDVTMNELHSHRDSIPEPERPYLDGILVQLGIARDAARARLMEVLDGPRYVGLLHALEDAAAAPKLSGEIDAKTLGKRSLRRTARHVRKAIHGAPKTCSPSELHHARIVARNGRYVAEACATVLGRRARRLAKRLSRMQETLGMISDATLIENRLRTLVVHDRANVVVGELLALQAAESERARDDWQSLRRKALRGDWLHA